MSTTYIAMTVGFAAALAATAHLAVMRREHWRAAGYRQGLSVGLATAQTLIAELRVQIARLHAELEALRRKETP
ncbi:hypothetical protein [Pseudomonas indica]|uniref:Uncharacterized protein n=1 Tax=Pseudomonas indica TaxID=137658 RepID=A0A1G8V1E9_9PSED|nr:hypothetical protein [Pseudomonas indica]SDJ59891.1 hypothetical protein SAMN05216186_10266 [Pseudomonas indica]